MAMFPNLINRFSIWAIQLAFEEIEKLILKFIQKYKEHGIAKTLSRNTGLTFSDFKASYNSEQIKHIKLCTLNAWILSYVSISIKHFLKNEKPCLEAKMKLKAKFFFEGKHFKGESEKF
jgi:hypothetical protein